MDINAFLENLSATDQRLPIVRTFAPAQAPETIDALFHLPLLALAAMVIARDKPFRTVDLGRSVALVLVEHFPALQRSRHAIEMSFTLRRRCADALAFLEASQLATISDDQQRNITLTKEGKSHMDRCSRDSSDLGLLIRQLRIAQERLKARIGDHER